MTQDQCILIVEDSALVAGALKMWLKEAGHAACHIASSAQEAVEAAAAHRPMLIFMDLRLPGKEDGVDAANQIHAIHDCPIIFVTGDTRPEALNRILEGNPAGILRKPFSEADLKRALDQVQGPHDRS